jgi:branched-chain amino acid transport system substrate-binding protein
LFASGAAVGWEFDHMNRTLSVLLALLLLLVGSAGAQDGDPIRIGAIFDLSGESSDVGTPYAEGIAAFIETLNDSGGIDGRSLELLGGDAGFEVDAAEQIYGQLTDAGVVAIMGWSTEESLALAGAAARDEIPFVPASSSELLNDPNGFAPYTFLVAPTYGDQLVALMYHMLELWTDDGNSAGDMRVAIFYHDSDFGIDPLTAGEDFARSAGIAGVVTFPMRSGAREFTSELQQADDYGVTHIVIQNLPRPAAQLANSIVGFFGAISPGRVGCLNWCANELFIEFAGAASENVLGAVPFAPAGAGVPGHAGAAAFLRGRGESLDEASLHFAQGWTAMSILAEAIQHAVDSGLEITGPNIRAALESMRDVETGDVVTPISFTANDHRGTRSLMIYVVQRGEWQQSSTLLDLR